MALMLTTDRAARIIKVSFLDIHCHILPGIDDGSESMEETIETLRLASEQGITGMIATPHFYPEHWTPDPQKVLQVLKQVQEQCRRENIEMSLYPGHECYYHEELADRLDRKEVLTLAKSRYVLVEFSTQVAWQYLSNSLRKLQNRGYRPILAHFERYACLEDEARLKELHEDGNLLQINLSRLEAKEFLWKKDRWKTLVRKGLVDFAATDCHGMHFRPPYVADSLKWLSAQQYFKQLIL